MKRKRHLPTLMEMVRHYRLRVHFTDQLPDAVPGYLYPAQEPIYIAINRRLPRSEQLFTLAHELGHCVRDHGNLHRRMGFWPLDHEFEAKVARGLVRRMRYVQNRPENLEDEADMMACLLMVQLGLAKELHECVGRHSALFWKFMYSVTFLTLRAWCLHPLRCLKRLPSAWREVRAKM